jgi:hypothetical protein
MFRQAGDLGISAFLKWTLIVTDFPAGLLGFGMTEQNQLHGLR